MNLVKLDNFIKKTQRCAFYSFVIRSCRFFVEVSSKIYMHIFNERIQLYTITNRCYYCIFNSGVTCGGSQDDGGRISTSSTTAHWPPLIKPERGRERERCVFRVLHRSAGAAIPPKTLMDLACWGSFHWNNRNILFPDYRFVGVVYMLVMFYRKYSNKCRMLPGNYTSFFSY